MKSAMRIVGCASIALTLGVLSTIAQAADKFYHGKTLNVYSPFGAGGYYTTIAQLVADRLRAHIPGQPTTVVQMMPGAGGTKMANYLYNAAPRDGTNIGLLYDFTPTSQLLSQPGVKFDVRKFGAIGAVASGDNGVIGLKWTSPATSISRIKNVQVVLGSTGVNSAQYMVPAALNGILHTKFKIVTGYKGTGAIFHAMEQGEVNGMINGYDSFASVKPDWIRDGKLKWAAQIGESRLPQLKDVPLLQELTNDPETRQILLVLSRDRFVGKAFVATPGVPATHLSELRNAFAETMKDPEFLALARKASVLVHPRPWQDVQRILRESIDVPPTVVEKVKMLTAPHKR